MNTLKAVISGDIVHSSLLGNDDFFSLQKVLIAELGRYASQSGFYRGDSFHALCEAQMAWRICVRLRTLAIAFPPSGDHKDIDIRISVGMGRVQGPVADLGTARGDIFVLSGQGLESMDKKGSRLIIRTGSGIHDTGLEAVSLYTDHLLRHLSRQQARVVHALMNDESQASVAGKLGISQPTVSRHVASAGWQDMLKLEKIFIRLASDPDGQIRRAG